MENLRLELKAGGVDEEKENNIVERLQQKGCISVSFIDYLVGRCECVWVTVTVCHCHGVYQAANVLCCSSLFSLLSSQTNTL
jgi:hypothetical protein